VRKTIAILLMLFCISCTKENDPEITGDVTISSRFYGTTVYYVYGYSFELEEKVPSFNSGGKLYDIIPENVINPAGDVIGVQFTTEGSNQYGFYKNGDFSGLSEAENYFNSYLEAENGPWSSLTDTLAVAQVYTYRTHEGNFVKFCIKDVQIIQPLTESEYVNVDIHYFIERSGTQIFSE